MIHNCKTNSCSIGFYYHLSHKQLFLVSRHVINAQANVFNILYTTCNKLYKILQLKLRYNTTE